MKNKSRKSCKKILQNKIRINVREFKNKTTLRNGKKFKSIKQAIATSFSQVKKRYPECFVDETFFLK